MSRTRICILCTESVTKKSYRIFRIAANRNRLARAALPQLGYCAEPGSADSGIPQLACIRGATQSMAALRFSATNLHTRHTTKQLVDDRVVLVLKHLTDIPAQNIDVARRWIALAGTRHYAPACHRLGYMPHSPSGEGGRAKSS